MNDTLGAPAPALSMSKSLVSETWESEPVPWPQGALIVGVKHGVLGHRPKSLNLKGK
jgi:hypothetical protein